MSVHNSNNSNNSNKMEESKDEEFSINEKLQALTESRDKFCDVMGECLDALSGVFPECGRTSFLLGYFVKEVKPSDQKKEALIKEWHKTMIPLYSLVEKKDEKFWQYEFPYFHELNMIKKWNDDGFTDNHKEVMWEYIAGLNKHSRLYNIVPSGFFKGMSDAASNMMKQFQSGEMKIDFDSFDVNQVKTIGEKFLNQMNKGDIDEFKNNIEGLASSMNFNGIQDVPRVLKEVGIPGFESDSDFTGFMQNIFNSDYVKNMAGNMKNVFENCDGDNSQNESSNN